LWLALTAGWWTLLGGGFGLLIQAAGSRGARLLAAAASPLSWAFRACGLNGLAAFFALS
jgi:hypothetical protein